MKRKPLQHHNKEEDNHHIQPPTNIITVNTTTNTTTNNNYVFTMKDQTELLLLAQKKFDYLRHENRKLAKSAKFQRLSLRTSITSSRSNRSDRSTTHSLSGNSTGSVFSSSVGGIERRRKGNPTSKFGQQQQFQHKQKVQQILSSLLYLSLMMHKVDDMKMILQQCDSTTYHEWILLFQSLHSPFFHLKERDMQNNRVRKLFGRKVKYKELYDETKKDLLQAQQTLQTLSQSITTLTQEIERTNTLLQERRTVEQDLASVQKENEIYKSQISQQNESMNENKIGCSKLRDRVESLQLGHGELVQKIQSHEHNCAVNKQQQEELTTDLEVKVNQVQELRYRVVVLEKDLEARYLLLEQEKENHQKIIDANNIHLKNNEHRLNTIQSSLTKSKLDLKQMQKDKDDVIKSLEQNLLEANNNLTRQTTTADKLQEHLIQMEKELDSKSSALKDSLELIKMETKKNQLLHVEKVASMDDISDLHVEIERTRTNNNHLTKSLAKMNDDLNDTEVETTDKLGGLANQLKSNEVQLSEKEREIAVLNSTIESLKQSLSDALTSKRLAEEHQKNLATDETKSVNVSIDKLIEETSNMFQMIASIKDELLNNVHITMKGRKVSEENIATLQTKLHTTEKEVVTLQTKNQCLEKSLSEAVEANMSTEKEMSHMKDAQSQNVHSITNELQIAEDKAKEFQIQLLEKEKEVASLTHHYVNNKSLETSFAESNACNEAKENRKQEPAPMDFTSMSAAIEQLLLDHQRLITMITSMKDSYKPNFRQEYVMSGQQSRSNINKNSTKDGSITKAQNVSTKDDDNDLIVSKEAHEVVSSAMDMAISNVVCIMDID